MKMNKTKQEQIFGTVEKVEKNTDYTGKETKTANVTVNNVDREISVDVNFAHMLGTSPTTAYPGHLGVETRIIANQALEKVQEETDRAKTQEEFLKDVLTEVDNSSKVRDYDLSRNIDKESSRAKQAEADILKQLDTTAENISVKAQQDKTELRDSITKLSKRVDQSDNDIRADLKDVEDSFNNQLLLLDNNLNNQITELNLKHSEDIQNLRQETLTNDQALVSKVDTSVKELRDADATIQQDVNTVKELYAEKSYVYEKLVEFTKLSKQIVDSVDITTNKVIVNNEAISPIDGVLYLVNKDDGPGPDFYYEYTLIDGIITLIGDTSISLDGYATEEWVQKQKYLEQSTAESDYAKLSYVQKTSDDLKTFVTESIEAIPGVDLTSYAKTSDIPTKLSQLENDSNYAKVEDIPDVSSFIAEIPDEYVTEDEMTQKGYYTLEDITKLLSSIELIDGGNASSLII